MDAEKLAIDLLLKGMTEEQQKAALDSIKESVSKAKAIQKQRIGENVQVVVQALKKIESDIRSRYDDLGNKIEARVRSIKDGKDGKDGKNGANGRDGRDGSTGPMGPKGKDGLNGRDGKDGSDGVSITDAHIDFDGSLIISLSSGRTINVGEVVAPDIAEKIKVITNGGGTSQSVLDTLASLQAQIDAIDTFGAVSYQGTWNASTNTPTIVAGTGTKGYYYVVSVAGSTSIDGQSLWGVGDWIIFNGSVWQKVDGGNTANLTDLIVNTSTTLNYGTANQVQYLNASKLLVGSSNLTFNGTTLVANDLTDSSLTSGRVTYAGTGGNLVDSANLTFNGTTLTAAAFSGPINGTVGATSANTGNFTTLTTSSTVTHNGGTANGVTYLNGSKVLTSGSALTFDGTNLGVGLTPGVPLDVGGAIRSRISGGSPIYYFNDATYQLDIKQSGNALVFDLNGGSEQMRLTSTGLGIGTSSPGVKLDVVGELRTQNTSPAGITVKRTDGVNANGWLNFVGSDDVVDGSVRMATDVANALTFLTASTERLRIDSSGNLGIGLSAPVSRLDVSSSASRVVNINSTSANGYGVAFQNSGTDVGFIGSAKWNFSGALNDMSITTNGAYNLCFGTNATERLRLDTSGNLGLGVTPSAWDSTYKAIQVGARSMFYGIGSEANMANNAYYNSGYKYVANSAAGLYTIDANVHKWYTAASGTAGNAITFTQAMTLDASGNLGIGTTSPADILHISKAGDLYLRVANTSTGINAYFGQDSNGTYIGNTGASVVRFIQGSSERVRIDTSGNVGIGTTSPAQKLEIAAASPRVRLTDTDGGYAQIEADNGNLFLVSDNGNTVANSNLTLGVDGTERARIDSSGNFLVGTTSSNGLVTSSQSATGTPSVAARASSTSFASDVLQIYCARDTNNASYNYITAARPAGTSFIVRDSGNVLNANNSYGQISDIKLKENITDATPKLNSLNQVRVVNFNFIGDQQKQIGVIAQELEQIFPGMVEETPDRDADGNDLGTTTKSVKYSVFVPMLIKAIQELKAEFDAYKTTHP